MKLFIEKHPELTKLSLHFREMEFLAEKFGIILDDHMDDIKFLNLINNNFPSRITGMNKGLAKRNVSSEKRILNKNTISGY